MCRDVAAVEKLTPWPALQAPRPVGMVRGASKPIPFRESY
jgi:hypothetical protein